MIISWILIILSCSFGKDTGMMTNADEQIIPTNGDWGVRNGDWLQNDCSEMVTLDDPDRIIIYDAVADSLRLILHWSVGISIPSEEVGCSLDEGDMRCDSFTRYIQIEEDVSVEIVGTISGDFISAIAGELQLEYSVDCVDTECVSETVLPCEGLRTAQLQYSEE